ncbi:MAG: FecR domain-containing protein, partial [Pigmentiphaga sp.]
MIDPDTSNAEHSSREQALDWFSRTRLGRLNPEEQQALEAWLAADPEHRREFQALQEVWRLADHFPGDEARTTLRRSERAAPVSGMRRRLLVGAGAGGVLMAAGLIGTQAWKKPPEFFGQFATAHGERRQYALPDGSMLDLNTASQATVAYYDNSRVATLQTGEALFSVHADTARPFTVAAGEACLRVLGTRFNVRHEHDSVQVAVTDGAVRLSAGPWWRRDREVVSAGQVAVASKAEGLVPPYPDHVDSIAAWQRGRLMF